MGQRERGEKNFLQNSNRKKNNFPPHPLQQIDVPLLEVGGSVCRSGGATLL